MDRAGKEGNTGSTRAIEAPGQQDGLVRHHNQFMLWRANAGSGGKSQGHGLPELNAIIVGLLGKFGDSQPAMLVDNRGFWPCPTQR